MVALALREHGEQGQRLRRWGKYRQSVAQSSPAGTRQVVPAMKGSARFEVAPVDNVLIVPSSALKNQKLWLCQKDGGEKAVEVVTGRSDGESVEIVSGLTEGDKILSQAKK